MKLFILYQKLQSRKTFGRVRKAIAHSGYDPDMMLNDLGLLEVEDLGSRWRVRTICLPTRCRTTPVLCSVLCYAVLFPVFMLCYVMLCFML